MTFYTNFGTHQRIGFINSMVQATSLVPIVYKIQYELRIKRPMSTAVLASPILDPVFGTILQHLKSKANVTYEPLLELVQVKASELTQLIKEPEAAAS